MDKDHLMQLLKKDALSREEKKWLLSYIETTSGKELEELLQQQFGDIDAAAPPDEETSRILLKRIHEKIVVKKLPVRRLRKWRMVVAASLVGLLIITTYYLAYRGNKKEVVQNKVPVSRYKNDVLPGVNKAILTLADGSKVILDDTQNGLVTTQGNSKIIKIGNKLSYEDSGIAAKNIVYNTIATPRAAQYQVELPDGSLVWLNAASSLRFPTAFTGGERRVEISGEAYFEVARFNGRAFGKPSVTEGGGEKKIPFIVDILHSTGAGGSRIEVLGTHFNVMAYHDEDAIKTTLLEGVVQFVSSNKKSVLQPGQQSQLTQDGIVQIIKNVNVNRVTAWKNGLFDFDNASIEIIMRQISRWYDVEVIFKSHHNKDLFMLELPRSSKLSDVLKILELTGNIKFEIDGKKVIVSA
jgi:transmembrane sensor